MVVQVCWWCLWYHQERSRQQTSRAPQFYRSTHQIYHRTPRNRWTPLPRYPDQTHPNSIESTVYRKPIHTDKYLDCNSNHPISAKLLSTLSSTELNKYVLHLNFLQRKWITFTKSYKTTTTQHSSFNKENPNRKPIQSQSHPQESS